MNSSGSPPHTRGFRILDTYVSKSPSMNLLSTQAGCYCETRMDMGEPHLVLYGRDSLVIELLNLCLKCSWTLKCV